MISHVFLNLPKKECITCISTNTENVEKLTLAAVKKSILAHWKGFIESDDNVEKTKDVFQR
jgi:hypothetical protein